MFISPVAYRTANDAASMMARSRSGMSHPAARPDIAAFAPLTKGVQSPLLSSIHRPALFFLMIRLTCGGGGRRRLIGGLNWVPLLGGGFLPACGPSGASTAPPYPPM